MLACHTAVTECTLDSSLNDEANPPLFADIRDGLQAMSSTLNLTHDREDSLCKGKRQQTSSYFLFSQSRSIVNLRLPLWLESSFVRFMAKTLPLLQWQSTANLRLSLWLESNRPLYDSQSKTLLPSSPSSPRTHRLANLSKSGKVFLVLLGQTRRPRIVR
jgi:hypothetical protein